MKKRIIICLIPLVLILAITFVSSAMPAPQSKALSDGILDFLKGTPLGDLIQYIKESVGLGIRKDAHVLLYFVTGIFSYQFFKTLSNAAVIKIPPSVASYLFCLIGAVADEYHQTFVDGRSGEIRDIVIDSIGFLSAIVISSAISHMRKGSKAKQN